MRQEKKRTFFGRIFYKLWKKIDKDDILTETEKLAFDIFEINLMDENNVLYLDYNPRAGEECKKYIVTKSYILNKDVNTFIILNSESNKIVIVNHQYRYDIAMPTKTCKIMDKLFNERVEKERDEMENEIFSNITQSLEIVLRQFKENIQKTKNEIILPPEDIKILINELESPSNPNDELIRAAKKYKQLTKEK